MANVNPIKIYNFKKESPYEISFTISGVDVSVANAIRRAMLANVETITFDIVKVKFLNGVIHDKVIAHRLGLIPLRRTNKLVKSAIFSLNVEYDPEKADENNVQTVYSSDLKPILSKEQEQEVFPISDKIIITKLTKGNKINLVIEASVGTGSIHAKWNPCCGTSYKENSDSSYTFTVETTEIMTSEEVFLEAIDYLIEKLSNYL